MPRNARHPMLDFAFALAVALALHLGMLSSLSYPPPQPDAADFPPLAIRFQSIPSVSPPEPAPVPKPERDPIVNDAANELQAEIPPSPPSSIPETISPEPSSESTPTPTTRAVKPSPRRPIASPPAPTASQLLANAETLILKGAPLTQTAPLAPLGQDAPRHAYIDRSTRDPNLVGYMAAWVKKVERVGALQYPAEIRRKRFGGQLTLDVAIRHDGSVASIDLLRPSRHPELDRAAERIVRRAAPYAPLPEAIRAETDILHITRVWRFTPGALRAFD